MVYVPGAGVRKVVIRVIIRVKNLVRFEYRVRADFLSFANFAIQCLIGDFLRADVLPTSPFREMFLRKSASSCLSLSGNIQVQHTVTPKQCN
jgi:hypothetical protein